MGWNVAGKCRKTGTRTWQTGVGLARGRAFPGGLSGSLRFAASTAGSAVVLSPLKKKKRANASESDKSVTNGPLQVKNALNLLHRRGSFSGDEKWIFRPKVINGESMRRRRQTGPVVERKDVTPDGTGEGRLAGRAPRAEVFAPSGVGGADSRPIPAERKRAPGAE